MRWRAMLVVLSVALNVGLLAYLIALPGQPTIFVNGAFAQNREAAGGGYAFASARINSNRQALWVIDQKEKRLIVYAFPSGAINRRNSLIPIGARDLRKDFDEKVTGDLVMIPGELASNYEGVYIIDTVGKRLIAYASPNGAEPDVMGMRNLDLDFRTAGGK